MFIDVTADDADTANRSEVPEEQGAEQRSDTRVHGHAECAEVTVPLEWTLSHALPLAAAGHQVSTPYNEAIWN